MYTSIWISFMIDENVNQSTRTVYTIADALSATGGFLGIITLIVQILIGWLQERLFIKSIIRHMFIEEREIGDLPQKKQKKHSL